MADTPLPFANGFYVSDSLPISAQECSNVFPHIPAAPALATETLLGIPGIYQVASSSPSILSAGRGAYVFAGRPYFVNGTNLYRLNTDNSLTNLGTISGTGRVSMAINGSQMMILVPGGAGYIFTVNPDVLTEITDTDFTANGNPQLVVFLDGYFVCTTDEGSKFIVSALNDGLDWNALDFGTAESSPDNAVVPVVFNNQLFIAGSLTIEAFNNIGGNEFPFQRTGLFIPQGVIAPFSVIQTSTTFMWIGAGPNESPGVWRLNGNTSEKISTDAIDTILQRLSDTQLAGIYAWAYGQGGHYFVGFSLPDSAIVFDTATNRWHERKSRVENPDSTVSILTYRVCALVSVGGVIYASDRLDGRIGILDIDTYTEYGTPIVRVWATQPFQNNMQPFFVPKLEMTVESGVGNTAEPDPRIRLQVSRDGGKTWSDERSRPMGRVGQYNRRAVWRRNGRAARFDVYRFIMSDPVKPVFIQLTAQLEAADDAAA